MLPLIPKSVKMEPEVSTRLKANASLIGYSENQLIVESVKGLLDLTEDRSNSLPRLVILLRSAGDHAKDPQHAGLISAPEVEMRTWWGV
jgi:hypothetical protein